MLVGSYNLAPMLETLSYKLLSYWSLNEASGTRADSADGNPMADQGSVTGASGFGNVGNVSVFDGGSNDYLRTSSSVFNSGNFTLAGWFNMNGAPAAQAFLINNVTQIGVLVLSTQKLRIKVSASLADGTTVLSTGAWNHVAMTYDGATMKAYLNGSATPEISAASAAVYTGSLTALGSTIANTSRFTGSLVGWGVWGRVLSAVGISNLYNSGNGLAFSSLATTVG